MSEAPTRRVLVVANLTESTPGLLQEVERRARGGCDFTLTVPPEHHAHWHRHGLTKQIQALGVSVTVIPPDPAGWSYSHGFPDEWVRTEISPLT
ncbi:MAG TPA: hypothetical protein VF072_14815 [Thermoleophilaceae bacterium]